MGLVLVGVVMAAGALCVGSLGYVLATYALLAARGAPKARLLRAATVEWLATMLLLPLWPLWWLLGESYERTSGSGRPIILLHGLGMNRTNWLWLGRRLAARGLGPLYGTTYFSPQTIERSAQKLQAFVAGVLAREGPEDGRVDIVAHSMGGVVARYFIEKLGGAAQIGRLITIGSPHRGTLLGRMGLVPGARQLHHNSPFYEHIASYSTEVAYASVWSRADALVAPPESASIEPAGRDFVFTDLGHLSMLVSPRVLDVVAERLSDSGTT